MNYKFSLNKKQLKCQQRNGSYKVINKNHKEIIELKNIKNQKKKLAR